MVNGWLAFEGDIGKSPQEGARTGNPTHLSYGQDGMPGRRLAARGMHPIRRLVKA